MKIVHVEAGMHLYGGAAQVLYLLEGLKKEGVANILVCPSGSRIASKAAPFADRVYPLPMRGDLDLPFLWRLRRVLRRESPDIVHLHSRRGADLLGGIASHYSGIKTVLSRRVDNPENPFWIGSKYKLYDKVIAISEGIRRVLIGQGVPPEKVACIRSAVDTKRYLPGGCERAWFQGEFRLPPGSRVIGVVAQLIPRKGHEFLLRSVPEILRVFPDVRVILFGKGALEGELQTLCGRLNIGDKVRFAGFRDDLPRIFPCLDLLVHPALMEGLGVTLLEAAASEIPIVATDVGGIGEAVRDDVNGYLIPPGRSEAIAEAVMKLLRDPEKARGMGRAGRGIVETEYSIDAMVRGTL
ncbi:MAG: glycosyltransferase family 4 protein, partial [Nitrospirae bacterium]|nr:glycosyltransferase family 4 protein [Nitrospirota bacterium]